VFVWVFGFSAFVLFYFKIREDELVQGFTDYVLCNAQMRDDCVNEHPIPMWIIYVEFINFTNIGWWLWLLFGLQKKVLVHWKKIFTHLATGNYAALKSMSIESKSQHKGTVKLTAVGISSSKETITVESSVENSRSA